MLQISLFINASYISDILMTFGWILLIIYSFYLARDGFLKYWKKREAWIMKSSNVGFLFQVDSFILHKHFLKSGKALVYLLGSVFSLQLQCDSNTLRCTYFFFFPRDYFIFFFLFNFNWRLITLQYYIGLRTSLCRLLKVSKLACSLQL